MNILRRWSILIKTRRIDIQRFLDDLEGHLSEFLGVFGVFDICTAPALDLLWIREL